MHVQVKSTIQDITAFQILLWKLHDHLSKSIIKLVPVKGISSCFGTSVTALIYIIGHVLP